MGMLLCVWPALNPLSIHITFTTLSHGRTQDRPRCALGWLQKLTHVPLAIAILLVQFSGYWLLSTRTHYTHTLIYQSDHTYRQVIRLLSETVSECSGQWQDEPEDDDNDRVQTTQDVRREWTNHPHRIMCIQCRSIQNTFLREQHLLITRVDDSLLRQRTGS